MLDVICFTSANLAYFDRACVLADSLRRHHPDWHFILIMTDKMPPGRDIDLRPDLIDEIIWPAALPIEDFDQWAFKHDVVEICTAVKGIALPQLLLRAKKVVYLDPDTCLFSSLDEVIDLLDRYSIVLTPHQLKPDNKTNYIIDNEICSLKTGIYNLGFIAVKCDQEGLSFAKWWDERLRQFCFDDIPNGIFVDQRWCDLIPAFFENIKILRHPGYNVASWNLSQRKVSIDTVGKIRCNEEVLRFWHFTKLGPVGDTMTERFAVENTEVYEIWNWYKRRVLQFRQASIPLGWWAFGVFEDGRKISKRNRVVYRSHPHLQQRYRTPFKSGTGSLQDWFETQT